MIPLLTSILNRRLSTSLRSSALGGPVLLQLRAPASVSVLAHNSTAAASTGTGISQTRSLSTATATATSHGLGLTSQHRHANRHYARQHQHQHQQHHYRSFSKGQMKDEYGAMDDSGQTYTHPGDFLLENGTCLREAQLRYQTYGQLNAARDNVIVVCHALTGNASLHSWWGDLLGPGRAFDTDQYFIVCCNILGSCYGSTSPVSINPDTGEKYGTDFPDVSVQDTVRLQLLLLRDALKVNSVKAVIGGSFGGMQAVEFAVQAGSGSGNGSSDCSATQSSDSSSSSRTFTDKQGNPYCRSFIPIACGVQHTAWQIAISEVQRQAIYVDPEWKAGNHFEATAGLQVARQIGMVSYRTPAGYSQKFGRSVKNPDTSPPYGSSANFQVKSYLEYQGQKFLSRFDPVTYVKMTEQMDSYDVSRGRGDSNSTTCQQVLAHVQIPGLVLGIDSDVLYPLKEQKELADWLPNGRLEVIHSDDGHDGFLLEQDQVAAHIVKFLDQHA
jgi:homoserine O-acetyltransferase